MHLSNSFHSPCSVWRRTRTLEAAEFAAYIGQGAGGDEDAVQLSNADRTNATILGDHGKNQTRGKRERKQKEKRPRRMFYCPYPFCSTSQGWPTLHELVAHVEGTSTETEDLRHEVGKWDDGWGADGWMGNPEAGKMAEEVRERYGLL